MWRVSVRVSVRVGVRVGVSVREGDEGVGREKEGGRREGR